MGTPDNPFITLPRLRGRNGPSSLSSNPLGRKPASAVECDPPADAGPSTVAAHGSPPACSRAAAVVLVTEAPSLAALIKTRAAQIDAGHTLESDAEKSFYHFLSQLGLWLDDARRANGNTPRQRNHAELYRCILRIGALALATLDRLDGAGKRS